MRERDPPAVLKCVLEWSTIPPPRQPLAGRRKAGVMADAPFLGNRRAPGRYRGLSTMTIWRPSIDGSISTLAMFTISDLTRSRSRRPKS